MPPAGAGRSTDADWRGGRTAAIARPGAPVAVGEPDRSRCSRVTSRAGASGCSASSAGRWLPQQSIRTLADADDPRAPPRQGRALDPQHVGLPRAAARPHAGRAGAERVAARARRAATRSCETGLIMLGEVASVSVAHRAFEAIDGRAVPAHRAARRDLARVGRAVPAARRARDHAGRAAAPRPGRRRVRRAADRALRADASSEWVRRLHEVTLPPLLHVLYRFGAAFSPHAQNCMLVLRDDVPARLVVKDFVDDMMVCSRPAARARGHARRRARRARRRRRGGDPRAVDPGRAAGVRAPLPVARSSRTGSGYAEAAFWAAAERAVARLPGALPGARGRASRCSTWTRRRS